MSTAKGKRKEKKRNRNYTYDICLYKYIFECVKIIEQKLVNCGSRPYTSKLNASSLLFVIVLCVISLQNFRNIEWQHESKQIERPKSHVSHSKCSSNSDPPSRSTVLLIHLVHLTPNPIHNGENPSCVVECRNKGSNWSRKFLWSGHTFHENLAGQEKNMGCCCFDPFFVTLKNTL